MDSRYITAASIAALLGAICATGKLEAAPHLSTLYTFQGGADGASPFTETLVPGPGGSLYGSTRAGTSGSAAVFQLSPPANGGTPWNYTLLQSFAGDQNGGRPTALLAGPHGSLFGEAILGGNQACGEGCGLVFQLIPPSHGRTQWSETILYAFSGTDGAFPRDGLIPDGQGNLFGTTVSSGQSGSCNGCGTVFELSPPAMGRKSWSLATLYTFKPDDFPGGKLLPDQNGGFYGITWGGGKHLSVCNSYYYGRCGTVYHLAPSGNRMSAWRKTTLYEFTGHEDGQTPYSELTLDNAGNVLGMAMDGGLHAHCQTNPGGCGTAFRLTPPARGQGSWTFSLLWQFTGKRDGNQPVAAGLTPFNGNYVTTTAGDAESDFGTVDLFTPGAPGQRWSGRTLFTFTNDANGADPESYLLQRDGVFYGMTHGDSGPAPYGTVFSLVP
ncbi:MAG: hypothetical protein IAI50_05875 [Candidatus Eremiobacteraeota bacterium]|nr:hypothetical protein [Candidatus Eremiobacteraeota bacterium]